MGKKYTVTIAFYDPNPSDDPEHDVNAMLKYGWKHQEHSTLIVGDILSEDYHEE